jgi:hypothetical protein
MVMRGGWLVLFSTVLIALAYAGDRLIVQAAQNAGTFPEYGPQAAWLLLDRLFRLLAVLGSGGVAYVALRGHAPRLAGVGTVALGLYFAAFPAVNAATRLQADLPLYRDVFWPAYLVAWVATVVTVVGLLVAVRPTLPAAVSPFWRAAAVVALVALAYGADLAIVELYQMAAAGTVLPLLAVDIAARFGVVTATVWLAWATLRGPRSRVVGGAMLVAGLYLAIGLAAGQFLLVDAATGDPVPGLDLLPNAQLVVRWVATVMTVLGVAELVWPSAERVRPESAAPTPAGSAIG